MFRLVSQIAVFALGLLLFLAALFEWKFLDYEREGGISEESAMDDLLVGLLGEKGRRIFFGLAGLYLMYTAIFLLPRF